MARNIKKRTAGRAQYLTFTLSGVKVQAARYRISTAAYSPWLVTQGGGRATRERNQARAIPFKTICSMNTQNNTLSEDMTAIADKHGIDPDTLIAVVLDVLAGNYDEEESDEETN